MAEVMIHAKLLDDIEDLMAEAGAPEAEIERVGEEVGEDEVRLVIRIEGARFWVGALECTRAGRSIQTIGEA